jgi:23S rRNA G2445 N2-methylase RlmL
VTLSAAERDELTALIRKGKAAARKLVHARVLLQVDESASGCGGTDEQTAQALNLSTRTVERVLSVLSSRASPHYCPSRAHAVMSGPLMGRKKRS